MLKIAARVGAVGLALCMTAATGFAQPGKPHGGGRVQHRISPHHGRRRISPHHERRRISLPDARGQLVVPILVRATPLREWWRLASLMVGQILPAAPWPFVC